MSSWCKADLMSQFPRSPVWRWEHSVWNKELLYANGFVKFIAYSRGSLEKHKPLHCVSPPSSLPWIALHPNVLSQRPFLQGVRTEYQSVPSTGLPSKDTLRCPGLSSPFILDKCAALPRPLYLDKERACSCPLCSSDPQHPLFFSPSALTGRTHQSHHRDPHPLPREESLSQTLSRSPTSACHQCLLAWISFRKASSALPVAALRAPQRWVSAIRNTEGSSCILMCIVIQCLRLLIVYKQLVLIFFMENLLLYLFLCYYKITIKVT